MKDTSMAESCPSSNANSLSSELSSVDHEIEHSRQDSTSPSPTETVCADALYSSNGAGTISCDSVIPKLILVAYKYY